MGKETKCCGNCIEFLYEEIDGTGQCFANNYEFVHCSKRACADYRTKN